MPKIKITGGSRFRRQIDQLKKKVKSAPKGVDVGFYETARYPPVHTGVRGGRKQKPLPVATVAAWNELGNKRVPERPFMRPAVERSQDDVTEVVVESKTVIDDKVAGQIGEVIKGHIQQMIIEVDQPPNAPSTVRRKQAKPGKGKTTPLIDTGKMLNSVNYKVIDK